MGGRALCARDGTPLSPRALYIDIDIHHGDGVEEAFYLTDRVLDRLLPQIRRPLFPRHGVLGDVGQRRGRRLLGQRPPARRHGRRDRVAVFLPRHRRRLARFDPGAVVLQCGADSLAGDRLGWFNLTLEGHAEAVASDAVRTADARDGRRRLHNANVARCWAGETGALLGAPMAERLPANEYTDFYGPDYQLAVPVRERERRDGGGGGRCALDSHSSPSSPSLQSKPGLDNANSPEYLATLRTTLLKHVAAMGSAPSVAIGGERPPDAPEPEAAPLWDKGADAGNDEPPARPE